MAGKGSYSIYLMAVARDKYHAYGRWAVFCGATSLIDTPLFAAEPLIRFHWPFYLVPGYSKGPNHFVKGIPFVIFRYIFQIMMAGKLKSKYKVEAIPTIPPITAINKSPMFIVKTSLSCIISMLGDCLCIIV